MARSVRSRPDPGQLAFLIDLDTFDQPAAAVASEVRPLVAPKREPTPPSVPEPVPTPEAVARRTREPEPDTGAAPPSVRTEPDWHGILDFERGWSGTPPAKQRAVRDRFAMTSARYHQLLDRALELPEALTYDPALVGRLRRIRETRRSKRFARRVDAPGDGPGVLGGWGEEGPTGG